MKRVFVTALLASALGTMPSYGQVLYPDYSNQRPMRLSAAQQGGGLGGGFIEALFGGGPLQPRAAQPGYGAPAQPQYYDYGNTQYGYPGQSARLDQGERAEMNPMYRRQVVDYSGNERPGTIDPMSTGWRTPVSSGSVPGLPCHVS